MVGALPLFSESWFTVYFFPLLLWPAAWAIASGFERAVGGLWRPSPRFLVGVGVAFALALEIGSRTVTGYGLADHALALRLGQLPAALAGLGVVLFVAARREGFFGVGRDQRKVLLFTLFLAEIWLGNPREFESRPGPTHPEYGAHAVTQALSSWMEETGVVKRHVRVHTSAGTHVAEGIASPNAGFVPFLTERQAWLRRTLFTPGEMPLGPLQGARYPDAWSRLSTTYHWTVQPGCATCKPVRAFEGGGVLYEDQAALPRAYLARNVIEITNPFEAEPVPLGDVALENVRGLGDPRFSRSRLYRHGG